MDERFPKYLRWLARKLEFLAVPNLGMLICGLAVLGFVGTNMLQIPLERFVFDPFLVRNGEWWRLFAFPIFNDPIRLLFFVLLYYFSMNSMEEVWGTSPLTLFTLASYLALVGAAFLADRPIDVWQYMVEILILAFGTLFPDLEFLLFFVLPVKAKWLAYFTGAIFILQFLVGDLSTKLFLLVAFSPYLLFFGPLLYQAGRREWRNRRRNR
jgi:hypothetical protein